MIQEFLDSSHILEYTIPIKKITIEIRKKYRLKLADALVAASAIEYDLTLVSADPIFSKVVELNFSKINP